MKKELKSRLNIFALLMIAVLVVVAGCGTPRVKYLESGQGMGQTLTMASEKEAYTLTDRATYLATKKNLKLDILLQGDADLLNIYHVMQVNPEKFPKVNADGAKAFVDFMINADTQKLIGSFGTDKYGQALFFADAGKKIATPTTPAPQTTETLKPANPALILATTTSTQDSGLLDVLIPDFEKKTGYKVKTIAVGTGAALAMGEKGEADVLLVHAPSSEKKLVDNQTGINYQLVMHNDFVIVGPSTDPAKVKETKTAVDAFKAIYASPSIFVSRGDKSGTDTMEKALWVKANIKPAEGPSK